MVGDVFGLLWDATAFVWRHFFDILEILFTVVRPGLGPRVHISVTGR